MKQQGGCHDREGWGRGHNCSEDKPWRTRGRAEARTIVLSLDRNWIEHTVISVCSGVSTRKDLYDSGFPQPWTVESERFVEREYLGLTSDLHAWKVDRVE